MDDEPAARRTSPVPPLQLRLEALPGAADAREELADEAEDDAKQDIPWVFMKEMSAPSQLVPVYSTAKLDMFDGRCLCLMELG